MERFSLKKLNETEGKEQYVSGFGKLRQLCGYLLA
jgi:hypothetical protein